MGPPKQIIQPDSVFHSSFDSIRMCTGCRPKADFVDSARPRSGKNILEQVPACIIVTFMSNSSNGEQITKDKIEAAGVRLRGGKLPLVSDRVPN